MIIEVEVHEARSHCTLMKNSESNHKNKKQDGKVKAILSIWYFKHKRLTYGRSTKHKSRLCAHERVQQWVFNYWETYAPVVN